MKRITVPFVCTNELDSELEQIRNAGKKKVVEEKSVVDVKKVSKPSWIQVGSCVRYCGRNYTITAVKNSRIQLDNDIWTAKELVDRIL